MYISSLELRNFRSFEEFKIKFGSGLNLLVGENNIGKTHVIDALRLVAGLGTGYRDIYPRQQDIRHDEDGNPLSDSFEIAVTFSDLSDEQLGWFVELLVLGDGAPKARLNYQYRRAIGKGSREYYTTRIWGGDKEGPAIPSEVLDSIKCVFLQPLRDAVADLRPGRASRTALLLERLSEADVSTRDEMIKVIGEANATIQDLPLVKTTSSRVNDSLVAISGSSLAQQSKLAMSEPTFRRIAQSLRTLVGSDGGGLFSVDENGLGYNNILYAATVLAEMRNTTVDTPDLGLLLIEEPEAHLHPQLQAPFVRYLEQQADQAVQVIATTHSSVIASSVGVERSVVVHQDRRTQPATAVAAKRLDSCGLEPSDLRLLTRYLDATRSCLLFARGVILVEGISELLLLPVFARKLGFDIKDGAISVVATGGLSFRPFYRLFQEGNLRIPCSVVTDGDPENATNGVNGAYTHGSRATALLADVDGFCQAFVAEHTFESALALAGNADAMIDALEVRHSVLGPRLRQQYADAINDHEKALVIRNTITSAYKADLAQDLAEWWELDMSDLVVPAYMQQAIRFAFGVQ